MRSLRVWDRDETQPRFRLTAGRPAIRAELSAVPGCDLWPLTPVRGHMCIGPFPPVPKPSFPNCTTHTRPAGTGAPWILSTGQETAPRKSRFDFPIPFGQYLED
jgi:hypothetical protein